MPANKRILVLRRRDRRTPRTARQRIEDESDRRGVRADRLILPRRASRTEPAASPVAVAGAGRIWRLRFPPAAPAGFPTWIRSSPLRVASKVDEVPPRGASAVKTPFVNAPQLSLAFQIVTT